MAEQIPLGEDKEKEPWVSGRKLLHYFAFYGEIKCLKLAVCYGADINARDRLGLTPIFVASMALQVSSVQ